MLEKTIKSVLTKKVENWLMSIDDEEIKSVIRKNLVITGGCFTSMIMNETPKDYDVYFKTKEAVIAVAEYYVNKFNKDHQRKAFVLTKETSLDKLKELGFKKDSKEFDSLIEKMDKDRIKIFISSQGVYDLVEENTEKLESGEDPVEHIQDKENKKKYQPVFISSNAITLSDGIQIVVRFYGEPKQIHETYDFVHTKAYWTSYEKNLVIPKDVYQATINKTLIYTGSRYPVCSIVRMRKFIQRGWKINAGQILKIAFQISKLDLENVDVLEDQLIGVDSLYFTILIEQLRNNKKNDENFTITESYISSIIDKIF